MQNNNNPQNNLTNLSAISYVSNYSFESDAQRQNESYNIIQERSNDFTVVNNHNSSSSFFSERDSEISSLRYNHSNNSINKQNTVEYILTSPQSNEMQNTNNNNQKKKKTYCRCSIW